MEPFPRHPPPCAGIFYLGEEEKGGEEEEREKKKRKKEESAQPGKHQWTRDFASLREKKDLYLCLVMYLCGEYVQIDDCRCTQRPEASFPSRVGIRGGHEPLRSGNPT